MKTYAPLPPAPPKSHTLAGIVMGFFTFGITWFTIPYFNNRERARYQRELAAYNEYLFRSNQ